VDTCTQFHATAFKDTHARMSFYPKHMTPFNDDPSQESIRDTYKDHLRVSHKLGGHLALGFGALSRWVVRGGCGLEIVGNGLTTSLFKDLHCGRRAYVSSIVSCQSLVRTGGGMQATLTGGRSYGECSIFALYACTCVCGGMDVAGDGLVASLIKILQMCKRDLSENIVDQGQERRVCNTGVVVPERHGLTPQSF